jgi:hypothetical protein
MDVRAHVCVLVYVCGRYSPQSYGLSREIFVNIFEIILLGLESARKKQSHNTPMQVQGEEEA